ncbi:hypothetical protein PR048_021284 [Dryococelus australis]|uniref:Uncharacterized protein n=1 Tax=Dryococelus australis TaxID=614101 RepID=A0ABQ9GXU8_9NEOP|nr:hypothetical protein PR048_021284 [Dryococelus australis]
MQSQGRLYYCVRKPAGNSAWINLMGDWYIRMRPLQLHLAVPQSFPNLCIFFFQWYESPKIVLHVTGVLFKVEGVNEERVMQTADSSSNSSKVKVKVVKFPKKPKTKKRKLLKQSETSSSSQPILPAGEPVTKQSLIGLGELYTTVQAQQTLPTSQQIVTRSQQTIAPSQPVLSLNQQNSLQTQQTWIPVHQLLALSSQILSQQQSIAPVQSSQLVQPSVVSVQGSQLLNQLSVTPGQSSQLLTQQPVTSLQGPQPLNQQLPRPPQPILTSLLKTTAQSKVVPPNSQKFGLAQSVKKTKLTGVKAPETEVKRTTAKPQAEVNTGNSIASESDLMNLKHKMTVQELKLRLRNRKAKAELEESELKMKMEASMQDLSNKKLKHDILLAKLQFYTKLCATENL